MSQPLSNWIRCIVAVMLGALQLGASAETQPIIQLLNGHGFLNVGSKFSAIDVPGSGFTNANGINSASQIVGLSDRGAFIRDVDGKVTIINGAIGTNLNLAVANGINDTGMVVGYYSSANAHGFLYNGGKVTTIDVPFPGTYRTYASDINNRGQIVGSFDTQGPTRGYLYADGSFTTIDVPGAVWTSVNGINDAGQIVGKYTDNSPTPSHGFLKTGGTFRTIDVPGALSTDANGINNAGQIVGSFTDSHGVEHGFLDINGMFTTVDGPNSHFSAANGINDAGHIVGDVISAVVPEPSSLALFSVGLLGLGIAFWRRKLSQVRSVDADKCRARNREKHFKLINLVPSHNLHSISLH